MNSIKIGARTYQILIVDDHTFFDNLLSKNVIKDESYKSFIDYDNQIIMIRSRFKSDYKQELLLHELLHACLEDSGYSCDDEIEKFVSIISPRLNQLLMNQNLIDLLKQL